MMNKNSLLFTIALLITSIEITSNCYRYTKNKRVCIFRSAVPVVYAIWPPRVEMGTVTHPGIAITECEGGHAWGYPGKYPTLYPCSPLFRAVVTVTCCNGPIMAVWVPRVFCCAPYWGCFPGDCPSGY